MQKATSAFTSESPQDITKEITSFLQPLLSRLQVKGIEPRLFLASRLCNSNFHQITLLSNINPITALADCQA